MPIQSSASSQLQSGPLKQYLIFGPDGQKTPLSMAQLGQAIPAGHGVVKEHIPLVDGYTASVDDDTRDRLVQSGYTVVPDDQDPYLLPMPMASARSSDPLQEMPPDDAPGPRPPLTSPRYDSDLTRQYTGKHVGIAYVDSGVYPHPDFVAGEDRIIAAVDFVNGRTLPYDDNGHGTQSIGNGSGNGHMSNGLFRGTAPESGIISVKVLNQYGQGRMSDIIKGIQWCIDHRHQYNIRVMNLSLGGPAHANYQNDPLERAVMKAWDAGIVVCAAAGNEGPAPGTISSPGDNPKVITVGAFDDNNTPGDISQHRLLQFESVGPTAAGLHKPDVLAPGEDIIGPNAPGTPTEEQAKKYQQMNDAAHWLQGMPDEELSNVPPDVLLMMGLTQDTVSAIKSSVPAARAEIDRIEQATARLPLIDQLYLGSPGSSRATPIVSGLVADMIEANPYLMPDDVKDILKSTARALPGANIDHQGAGEISPDAALRKAIQLRDGMAADPARQAMVAEYDTNPDPASSEDVQPPSVVGADAEQAPAPDEPPYKAKN